MLARVQAPSVRPLMWFVALGYVVVFSLGAASDDPLAWVGLILVVLAHTAALFYWGGRTSKAIETLSGHVGELREWKHDVVTPKLSEVELLRWRLDHPEEERRGPDRP